MSKIIKNLDTSVYDFDSVIGNIEDLVFEAIPKHKSHLGILATRETTKKNLPHTISFVSLHKLITKISDTDIERNTPVNTIYIFSDNADDLYIPLYEASIALFNGLSR